MMKPHHHAMMADHPIVFVNASPFFGVPRPWSTCLQVEAFAETLKPHQRAVTADGTTVLDKAVIDHNLAAASKLYNNIYFTELGQLLGCSEEQAEATASQMVMEDRLQVGRGVLANEPARDSLFDMKH